MSLWAEDKPRSEVALFVAFALAVAGQLVLAPPWRMPLVGVPLLVVGAVLWVLSTSETGSRAGTEGLAMTPIVVRWLPVFAAAVLAGVGFPLFAGNRFTAMNTALWVLSVALGVWGLWGKNNDRGPGGERQTVDAVTLVLFAVVALFRLANLSDVPANPWSDHAEKLEDVFDLKEGHTRVFFPRNTGREAFQFYWSLVVGTVFGTGVSFFTLKLGTALLGLAAVWYVYRLAYLLGGRTTALWALFLYGVAYWPNLMGRIGLRFPLYQLFAAAVLFYLYRGLAFGRQRDFVLAGLFLGVGLHGYSPFRVVPGVVVLVLVLFWLARRREVQTAALWQRGVVVAFVSFLVFVPLASVAVHNPGDFWYRAATRWASVERPLPAEPLAIFAENVLRALAMFNWDNGEIFAICVPHRPALDTVTGALFVLGTAWALRAAFRQRSFFALSLLAVIPFFQLPSTLSLAFPNENPALNRAGAAAIPAILLAAWAASQLFRSWSTPLTRRQVFVGGVMVALVGAVVTENYRLVFQRFARDNRLYHFDTGAVGAEVRGFLAAGGHIQNVGVVRVPHWMDTRLGAIAAGVFRVDLGIDRQELEGFLSRPGRKLLVVKDDDHETLNALRELRPEVRPRARPTNNPGGFFWVFELPGAKPDSGAPSRRGGG